MRFLRILWWFIVILLARKSMLQWSNGDNESFVSSLESWRGESIILHSVLDKENGHSVENVVRSEPMTTKPEAIFPDKDEERSSNSTIRLKGTLAIKNPSEMKHREEPAPYQMKSKTSQQDTDISEPVKKKGSFKIIWKASKDVSHVVLNKRYHNVTISKDSKLLVLFTSAEESKYYAMNKILNVLSMFSLFQKTYSFQGIVFTHSASIQKEAKALDVMYVEQYQENLYHLPVVSDLFSIAKKTIRGEYYGFINSDIVLSPKIFTALTVALYNSRIGVISPLHELAGRVFEVNYWKRVNSKSIQLYTSQLKSLSNKKRLIRPPNSADYFIFSRAWNFTHFKPVVIGRLKVDNYLLSLPHEDDYLYGCEAKCQKRIMHNQWNSIGHLIDSTVMVLGIHIGCDSAYNRLAKELVGMNNRNWNLQYYSSIEKKKGSLFYSHCVLSKL